jgi:hypothetical protein
MVLTTHYAHSSRSTKWIKYNSIFRTRCKDDRFY